MGSFAKILIVIQPNAFRKRNADGHIPEGLIYDIVICSFRKINFKGTKMSIFKTTVFEKFCRQLGATEAEVNW